MPCDAEERSQRDQRSTLNFSWILDSATSNAAKLTEKRRSLCEFVTGFCRFVSQQQSEGRATQELSSLTNEHTTDYAG